MVTKFRFGLKMISPPVRGLIKKDAAVSTGMFWSRVQVPGGLAGITTYSCRLLFT